MMFEKQFPSLSQNEQMLDEFKKNYMASMVQKHCLDKQRVKEVLNSELLIEVITKETKKSYGLRLIKKIEEELGLK